MQVKGSRERLKALSHKEKFIELSGQFGVFGRLLQTSSEEFKAKAENDAFIAKMCAELSEVCKMLAKQSKEESNHAS